MPGRFSQRIRRRRKRWSQECARDDPAPTVRDFEEARRVPTGDSPAALLNAFEAAGVTMLVV